jgi:hypothetical protein
MQYKDGEHKYLQVVMAGTAAESIVFGSNMISNGAEQDIHHATARAWTMLGRWGWDKYASALTQEFKDFCNKVPDDFCTECERIVAEAKRNATDVLNANLPLYKEMLSLLLTKEKLKDEDFVRIFQNHNIPLFVVKPDETIKVGYDKMTTRFLTTVETTELPVYVDAIHVDEKHNSIVTQVIPTKGKHKQPIDKMERKV